MATPEGYPDQWLIGSRPLPSMPPSDFGNPQESAASDGLSITTATAYQPKLTHVTAVLPAGLYRIAWSAEGTNSDGGKLCKIRVRAGATVLGEVQLHGKAGDEWQPEAGLGHVTLAVPGAITLDIYWAQALGGTAKIRKARIEVWRLA